MECEVCEKAKNKLVLIESVVKKSPLSKKFPQIIADSQEYKIKLNTRLLENKCAYTSGGRLCTVHKSDVESIEINFLKKVKESFTQFFGSEENDMHQLRPHDHKAGRNIKRLAPAKAAAEFENFQYAEMAFGDLEKKLIEEVDGETTQEVILQQKARHARAAAGILDELGKIYGAADRNPAMSGVVDELLAAEGSYYKMMLHHYAAMLNQKTIASKSSHLFGRLAGSQAAAGAFWIAGLAHYLQFPAYESFRNAVASLPGIRDLSAPLAIPAEFLLAAGASLFAAQSLFNELKVTEASRSAYFNDLQNSAGKFEKSLKRQNITQHTRFHDGNFYVQMPLPKSDGSEVNVLEFRIEKDTAVSSDGGAICRRTDGQSFHALEELYGLAEHFFRHSGEKLKNSFDLETDIATCELPDGRVVRYKLTWAGGIKKVGGDAEHYREHQFELRKFYLSERKKAIRAEEMRPAHASAIAQPQQQLPAPTIIVYQPVHSLLGTDYVAVKDNAGKELANLVYGNALNNLLATDVLTDLNRNIVWDSRGVMASKLPNGVKPEEVIRIYVEQGWRPITEFNQTREFRRNFAKLY